MGQQVPLLDDHSMMVSAAPSSSPCWMMAAPGSIRDKMLIASTHSLPKRVASRLSLDELVWNCNLEFDIENQITKPLEDSKRD